MQTVTSLPAPHFQLGECMDIDLRVAPHAGDLVIAPDANQTPRFILGSLEHRRELICASRLAAIEHATRYASSRGVSVWQVDQQAHFTLIFTPWQTVEASTAIHAAANSPR